VQSNIDIYEKSLDALDVLSAGIAEQKKVYAERKTEYEGLIAGLSRPEYEKMETELKEEMDWTHDYGLEAAYAADPKDPKTTIGIAKTLTAEAITGLQNDYTMIQTIFKADEDLKEKNTNDVRERMEIHAKAADPNHPGYDEKLFAGIVKLAEQTAPEDFIQSVYNYPIAQGGDSVRAFFMSDPSVARHFMNLENKAIKVRAIEHEREGILPGAARDLFESELLDKTTKEDAFDVFKKHSFGLPFDEQNEYFEALEQKFPDTDPDDLGTEYITYLGGTKPVLGVNPQTVTSSTISTVDDVFADDRFKGSANESATKIYHLLNDLKLESNRVYRDDVSDADWEAARRMAFNNIRFDRDRGEHYIENDKKIVSKSVQSMIGMYDDNQSFEDNQANWEAAFPELVGLVKYDPYAADFLEVTNDEDAAQLYALIEELDRYMTTEDAPNRDELQYLGDWTLAKAFGPGAFDVTDSDYYAYYNDEIEVALSDVAGAQGWWFPWLYGGAATGERRAGSKIWEIAQKAYVGGKSTQTGIEAYEVAHERAEAKGQEAAINMLTDILSSKATQKDDRYWDLAKTLNAVDAIYDY